MAGGGVFYYTCPVCEATCGLEVTVDQGRVTHITGDREDLFSQGYLCSKGASLHHLLYDPDRLTRPLVRREKKLVPVSWAEAFEAAEKGLTCILGEHGRNAAAVYLGNPVAHSLAASLYARPLIKALATQNIYSASTVDQMPKQAACGFMYGSGGTIPVPDLDRTSFLLMLGANPAASNGSLCTAPGFMNRLRSLRERGGRLVVVDPYRSGTARLADEHLFIRPGADPWLLFGLVNVILEENLADPGRLSEFIDGLDALRETAKGFTPEAAGEATGIDPDVIRRLARELASADSAAVYGRIGTCTTPFGTLTSWLIDVLAIITGNFDRPGGIMFNLPAHAKVKKTPGGRGFKTGRWSSRVNGLPEVCGELPVAALVDEITTPGEGRIRALITVAGNPALSLPGGARLEQALDGLDFMISVDFYLNETSRLADVVLPPPPPLAFSQYDLMLYNLAVRRVANYSPLVVDHPHGPPLWEILALLAMIAGGQGAAADPALLDDFVVQTLVQSAVKEKDGPLSGRDPAEILAALEPRRGPERILDLMLRTGPYGDAFGAADGDLTLSRLLENPHGLDFGPMIPRLPEILSTPSGKIELAPTPLIDDARRLLQTGAKAEDQGLTLIGRRHLLSNNTWFHNIEPLMKGGPRCTLMIHPDDAARLDLTDGARAKVTSASGSLTAPVEITDDIKPGIVSLPHGWGHDRPESQLSVASRRPGVNSNTLADINNFDPLSGASVLTGIPVQIEKM